MNNLSILARRLVILTSVGVGGSYLLTRYMPNQETAPQRHNHLLNWVNLGCDKIYYHAGSAVRGYILSDPESAHERAVDVTSKSKLVRGILGLRPPLFDYANLHSEPFQEKVRQKNKENQGRPSETSVPLKRLHFWNPVGLAAGWDKDGRCIDGVLDMGFGFTEIGSVTPLPQPGNPKPRLFRLEVDRAIINRYGFNSQGADIVSQRLNERRHSLYSDGIVGINLGKNKTSEDAIKDYQTGIEKLGRFADYIVVNVSSPNTPGLRNLQHKSELQSLLSAVKSRRDEQAIATKQLAPPLLVKIAPDLTDQDKDDIAEVALRVGLDGLIISNTTIERDPHLRSPQQNEVGGLSGAPLKHKSTQLIHDMYKRTQGQLVIIGVGGVENGLDAYEKIRAGASLVQIYSSFVYGGPYIVHLIKRDLSQLLQRDGFRNVSEAVGSTHRNGNTTIQLNQANNLLIGSRSE